MAVQCYYEEQHLPVTVQQLAGGDVVFFSARAPGKESVNEDSLAIVSPGDQCDVLIVADGVGGHPEGALASRLAVDSVVAELEHPDIDADGLRTAILRGIDRANHAILDRGSGAATTLAIAEISANVLRTYHIGDSLLMVTGQRGKLKFQSIPHSPVGYAVASGLLDETEAMESVYRHLVSNVVGSQDMRVEIGPPLELAPFDTVVLASDGLSDNLTAERIIGLVCNGPLESGIENLYVECNARMLSGGHPDDLTVVSFRPRGG